MPSCLSPSRHAGDNSRLSTLRIVCRGGNTAFPAYCLSVLPLSHAVRPRGACPYRFCGFCVPAMQRIADIPPGLRPPTMTPRGQRTQHRKETFRHGGNNRDPNGPRRRKKAEQRVGQNPLAPSPWACALALPFSALLCGSCCALCRRPRHRRVCCSIYDSIIPPRVRGFCVGEIQGIADASPPRGDVV